MGPSVHSPEHFLLQPRQLPALVDWHADSRLGRSGGSLGPGSVLVGIGVGAARRAPAGRSPRGRRCLGKWPLRGVWGLPRPCHARTLMDGSEEEAVGGVEACGREEEESWVDWLRRTARALDCDIKKGALVDWVAEQRRRKWRWAGHVARRTDGRWARQVLHWIPHGGERRRAFPLRCWSPPSQTPLRTDGRLRRSCGDVAPKPSAE